MFKNLLIPALLVSNIIAQVPDWQTCFAGDSCISGGFRCCIATADLNSGKSTCRPLAECAATPIGGSGGGLGDGATCTVGGPLCNSADHVCCRTPGQSQTTCQRASQCESSGTSWAGTNHFFLHTLPDQDQQEIIDTLQRANIKVLRLFISTIYPNFKGTNSIQTNDIELNRVGVYENTVLDRLDALLPRLERAGIKAIIALHDRYMLGAWGIDAYVQRYALDVVGTGFDGNAKQQLVNFYGNPSATAAFDRRIAHILSYQSKSYPGKTIGQLSNVVSSFNIQNEPFGHLERKFPGWLCNRAGNAKRFTSIPLSTGGGHEYANSVDLGYFLCPHLDHIGIHTYDLSMGLARKYLREAHGLALAHNKKIVLEEFGATGDKATQMGPLIQYANQLGIPWMVWQTLKPNNPADFEFWIEDRNMWRLMESEAARALLIRTSVAP